MGRRTATGTIANLFVAFLENSDWKQKDLERRCGVSTRAIRKAIFDMQEAGIPLSSDVEHPHVIWSVPKGWFPGHGIDLHQLDAVEVQQVVRLVGRLPKSPARERVLTKLVRPALGRPSIPSEVSSSVDEDVLRVLEESALRGRPIRMGYFTASRGEPTNRIVTVARIVYGDRIRFVAYCHTTQKLKWFRADRVTSGPRLENSRELSSKTPVIDPSEVVKLIAESLNGYRGEEKHAQLCRFHVDASISRWVTRNLPEGADYVVEQDKDGATVTVRTAAMEVLARFIVGLGGAVRVLEPTVLRLRARAIAKEALATHGEPISPRPSIARGSAGHAGRSPEARKWHRRVTP